MVAAAAAGKRKRDLSEDEVYLILHKSVLLLNLRATRRFSWARPRVLVRRSILLQVLARDNPDGASGGGAARGEKEHRLEGAGGQDSHGDHLRPRVPDALALHRLPT